VKEVGEALNNYRYKNRQYGLDVHCIGIASWGYTAGNEQLDNRPITPLISTHHAKGTRSFMRQPLHQTVSAIPMVSSITYLRRKKIFC